MARQREKSRLTPPRRNRALTRERWRLVSESDARKWKMKRTTLSSSLDVASLTPEEPRSSTPQPLRRQRSETTWATLASARAKTLQEEPRLRRDVTALQPRTTCAMLALAQAQTPKEEPRLRRDVTALQPRTTCAMLALAQAKTPQEEPRRHNEPARQPRTTYATSASGLAVRVEPRLRAALQPRWPCGGTSWVQASAAATRC
jgi:hypothetical protein